MGILVISGYMLSLGLIFLLNKYYIEEDCWKGVSRIDIPTALFISILNWVSVLSLALIVVFITMGETRVYKRMNEYFKGEI